MKTITNIIYLAFALFAFACFALLPPLKAQCPSACGAGGNTGLGDGALDSVTTGINNTAVGKDALTSNTIGSYNVAIGRSALSSNVAGNFNMAIGTEALRDSTANFNLAIGFRVGFVNTTGSHLTGIGAGALLSNTTGNLNTAIGSDALSDNSTGGKNTAIGSQALKENTTGKQNTASGFQALFNNTTESFNTATGFQALFSNTGDGGHYNVATGYQALFSNTTGRRNVAEGNAALYSNVVGNFNVAVGDQALFSLAPATPTNGNSGGNTAIGEIALANLTTGGGNTALGNSALINSATGFQNVALGYVAGQNLTDGNNNVYISNPSIDTESNTIRIGNVVGFTDMFGFPHAAHSATFIAGISGQDATGGDPVFITSDGKLGTVNPPSSARFKEEIKPMDHASEVILALKPVTFRYKKEFDPTRIPQFGLVAEEVEKANPDLVKRDREGKVQTVRYEAVNAMLLNEFLKEHRKIKALEAGLAQQQDNFQATITRQQKQIEALTAGLQKVSAQLELSKPATQTALRTND